MTSKPGVFHERKDCILRVRVEARIKKQLEQLARSCGRTVSELVRYSIYEMLRNRRKENVLHSK